MRVVLGLAIGGFCACSGGSSAPRDATTDVATAIDASIDAAIDAPPDPGVHHHFVIDSVSLPTDSAEVVAFGIDLDGDSSVDNQLGGAHATLSTMGADNQPVMDTLMDTGAVIMLADLGAVDTTATLLATFTIYQGADPVPAACASAQDTVCRNHLTGSGSFSIAQGAPVDPPLVGTIANSALVAGPNHLTIQFSLLGSQPVMVTLLGARVELVTTTSMGKLAGGVRQADVDSKLVPSMRDAAEAAVQRDCTMLQNPPGCGCATDSEGKTMLALFDVGTKDCSVSQNEVRNNALLGPRFVPDVMVEGQMAVSIGIGVHLVGGTFTPPS